MVLRKLVWCFHSVKDWITIHFGFFVQCQYISKDVPPGGYTKYCYRQKFHKGGHQDAQGNPIE